MQILIIEDEERLADALGQIMEEAKYMVDIVHDGKEGLLYGMNPEASVEGCPDSRTDCTRSDGSWK